ncbi:glycoside hydrolase family 1 protein [Candidatus Uhrbacteria bacterium]|nr:glycoside hydrolase family 1 protein [Candidatus Uhrbacteria bacterium]
MQPESKIIEFRPGFLWGTATSAHQLEGGNDKNDWWLWEQAPGHIADGSRSEKAADHYRLWREDFTLAKELGLNAQRISIEWSRIEPEEGLWDEEALRHYREALAFLKSQSMTVMVTLWHFTLPQWVSRQGGWSNEKTVRDFKRFVAKVAEEYAEMVDFWLTINEPMIYLWQGYWTGKWPPGKRSILAVIRAFRMICRAHRSAYRIIHEVTDCLGKRASVGMAKNVICFDPFRESFFADRWLAQVADWFWNRLFFSRTRGSHDFIGVNYYFHNRLAFNLRAWRNFFFEIRNENREVSGVGWEVYPVGLFAAVKSMARWGKPIYITENGLATDDDQQRIRFIASHLAELRRAMASGADVRGYFYWSLLDAFEWEQGFSARFGLVEADSKTQERRRRPSADYFGSLARANGILLS